jgi:hypothetical protein
MKNLILVSLIVLTSCSSRKVTVDKTETKKDSVIETKVIVSKTENITKKDSTSITKNTDDSEITITPIDTSKAIIINGKSYKNVILSIKKKKSNTLYTNNKKELGTKNIDSTANSNIKVKEQTDNKSKKIDAEKIGIPYFWILLILIILILWLSRR